MAVTEGKIEVGETGKSLDTTIVTQTDSSVVHREVIVLADPETFGNYANIMKIGSGFALCANTRPPIVDAFSAFGEQDISGAQNNVDTWGGPTDTQPEPDTGGYSLFLVSSDADDDGDPVGTGMRTVRVDYLDTAGAQQSVDVTLNGVTEVDSGVSDCMFVQQHHAITVGSNNVAVGDIDCLAGTGGAVVSRITATGNQSMSTARQVPAGNNLIVTGWHASGTAATTKLANLRIRSSDIDGVSNPGVYHFRDSARVKDFATGHLPLFFSIPPLAVLKISAWTTGTIGVSAHWDGYLESV